MLKLFHKLFLEMKDKLLEIVEFFIFRMKSNLLRFVMDEMENSVKRCVRKLNINGRMLEKEDREVRIP